MLSHKKPISRIKRDRNANKEMANFAAERDVYAKYLAL